MTLLEEFEQNVKTVVEVLENCLETIEQQFIYENEQVDQKEGIILKTSCVKGLKEEAAWNVSIATFMSFSLWGNAFNEILMWLTRYMPQFKGKIERQYCNIVKRVNAIPSVQHAFRDGRSHRSRQTEERQSIELFGFENEIRKLADDLRYCAKIAREELGTENPEETRQKDEGSKIMITAKTSKENWEAIRSEYDISKKDFGKKIKFVSDSFKRKIIFRDVEHAFVLASQGFSKPALILAGGVIEELLRQYLERKNIKLKNKRFVDYIKACEDNDLLKRGVYRLSDSIRDFRNLVHLDNEKTKRHTVSKATAKGAVSSIFTIANDFQ